MGELLPEICSCLMTVVCTYSLLFLFCQISLNAQPFAGEVKRHKVCKRHGFLDAGFKQTGPLPLSLRYPNGINNLTAF